MKLKKITLENIRSYEKQEIEFPEGSTLLWGDIGSGKTSILLAIEFALFGLQPGQRGSSLLRNGVEEGKVILEFEVDNQNILIERTLKKSKTIAQDYCSISIDSQKQEISVTELKNKVLELLNYPREFSKKQNLLYKFTVYTPQEQMKEIILQDANSRLDTLRHVFGIDKYKKILENISIISTKLREEKKLKEGMIFNLSSDKNSLELKYSDLEKRKIELLKIEGELNIKIEQRNQVEKEKKAIEEKILEKNKLQQEIEKSRILLSTKEQHIFDTNKSIEQINNQIAESVNLVFNESQVKELENKLKFIQLQKQELNDKMLQISSKIHSLTLKNSENTFVKERISKIEICPTCLQDVAPVYKSNVMNKFDSDTFANVNQINELTLEKQDISKKITSAEIEYSTAQKNINELNILKIRIQGVREKQQSLINLQKQVLSLEKDIDMLKKQIQILKDSVFELSKFDNLFELKQRELNFAQQQEKLSEIKLAELRREIVVFSSQIDELKQRILRTEQVQLELDYLNQLEDWISKKFTPVISYIEKNVMVKLKSEFSNLFSKWFCMLVSDNFNVRLADDFTPIIEQQDYELDYAYLSGGERTAIALAYRLALNQVINSLLSKIKTKDLVILDEPTDGFSDQQLDKMRDVLQQLNVAQLIIVSHEQKMESFVENVIKFRKEKGLSVKD